MVIQLRASVKAEDASTTGLESTPCLPLLPRHRYLPIHETLQGSSQFPLLDRVGSTVSAAPIEITMTTTQGETFDFMVDENDELGAALRAALHLPAGPSSVKFLMGELPDETPANPKTLW